MLSFTTCRHEGNVNGLVMSGRFWATFNSLAVNYSLALMYECA